MKSKEEAKAALTYNSYNLFYTTHYTILFFLQVDSIDQGFTYLLKLDMLGRICWGGLQASPRLQQTTSCSSRKASCENKAPTYHFMLTPDFLSFLGREVTDRRKQNKMVGAKESKIKW